MTDIGMIEAAATRFRKVGRVTPFLNATLLDEETGRRIFVKAECLQHTGSFKFRGAWSALSALSPDRRANGVVAFSSGNHAQGVALAARLHGVPAVIVMPSDAPATKIASTRAYGAEVVLYDRWNEDRDAIGNDIADRRGLRLVKPFDDPDVIAGQGTTGLEIAAQAAEAGLDRAEVLVPCGGGGLASGIAIALAARAPGLRVRPCEPENFNDMGRSLEQGRIVPIEPGATSICDAIVTPRPGDLTFPIVSRLCGPGLAISDDEARAAMAVAFRHFKLVVEPGGAAALAAALFRADALDRKDVIVVASGGNVDPSMFASTLETGEDRAAA